VPHYADEKKETRARDKLSPSPARREGGATAKSQVGGHRLLAGARRGKGKEKENVPRAVKALLHSTYLKKPNQ